MVEPNKSSSRKCIATPSYHKLMVCSDKESKTIAIFGGSFDPPTISHTTIACEIYNQLQNIDEVWIVPCGDHRTDKMLRTKIKHRIKMIELILSDIVYPDIPIYVKDTEETHGKFMPTIDLLDKLKNENPSFNFQFCIGTDLISDFKSWEEYDRIINEYGLIIITRPSYPIEDFPYKYDKVVVDLDGSSSNIRNRIELILKDKNKVHLGISGLTTRSVIEYIYLNELYKVSFDDGGCLKSL